MKKRSEGFWGIHFDFHAREDCTEVGKTVTEEMIREIVETLHPDYVQCDCKGHDGYSSYMTKVGNPAPGFVHDQLKTWRKVTKEFDLPLIMHYSGVFDTRALELHPEWAVTNEDGTLNKNMTSTFKGYADGLLIPQLVELATEYGVDGAWIDGECWATLPEFDSEIMAMFETQSGIKLKKESDGKYDRHSADFRVFLEFCSKQFLKYVDHYTKEVHKSAKDFEIASNWAFSTQIPIPVCVDVDYLTGDFSPNDSYNSARFEARILCEQNIPWDLMAWDFYVDFSGNNVHEVKSADTLCREAACIIPLGGGFQLYSTQNRDGSVKLWEVRQLKRVAEFMREREPFLKDCKPFSNIGILYSYKNMRFKNDGQFFNWNHDETKGAIRMTLDSAHTCGVLMDHMLTDEHLNDKNIIILPETHYITDEMKKTLLKFVENGGNLIVSGHECCKLFEDSLAGVTISTELKNERIFIYDEPRYVSQSADVSIIETSGESEILMKCSSNAMGIDEPTELNVKINPIVTKTKLGKGCIIAVYYNVFKLYHDAPNCYVRNIISKIIDSLDAEKFIEYKGLKFVDIVTAKKDGKLLINLTNTSGIYSEARVCAYDEIMPLTNMEIDIKLGKEPKSVLLQPENIVPEHKYNPQTQRLTVKVDKVDIHSVIVIDA